jgi:hypothetical protein
MEKNDQLFMQMLYIFQASAMQALGKIKNPITGKTEKNLEQARQAIDMLEMIKEKTTGNLSSELENAINACIAEARMTYVNESSKN